MWPDINVWIDSAEIVASGHILKFYTQVRYSGGYEYPPLWLFFCWLTYTLHPTLDAVYLFLIKLPLTVADVIIGIVVYVNILHLTGDRRWAAIAAALWIFNPRPIINGARARFDSICLMFLVLSAYLLFRRRLGWSGIAMGLACLTKQYAYFFTLPAIVYVGKTFGWRKTSIFIATCLGVFAAFSTPWLLFDRYAYFKTLYYRIPTRHFISYSMSLWGLLGKLERIDVLVVPDWLVGVHYYIFYGVVFLLPAALVLFFRLSNRFIGEVYQLPAITFLIFSPQVFPYYHVLFIPFLCVSIGLRLRNPLWYLTAVFSYLTFFFLLDAVLFEWLNLIGLLALLASALHLFITWRESEMRRGNFHLKTVEMASPT
jgi:4-amino-4-deoxy-L-arabinose transferase-like glycosyltransferase